MNISYNKIVKKSIPFFIIILIAFILNTILQLILPKNIDGVKTTLDTPLDFKKFRIYNSFYEQPVKKESVKTNTEKKEYKFITNIELKAIYSTNNKKTGWVVINEKSSSEAILLSVGDNFKDYMLKEVYIQYVIFEKDSKEYKLSLFDEKEDTKFTTKTVTVKDDFKDIEHEEGIFKVKRDLVDSYTKDLKKIFSEISIKEIVNNGEIDGFKINSLTKNSVFDRLGLKAGDIIKEVNNIKLKSYNDAFKFYNTMNTIDVLNFKILRDDQLMEIEYEIR